VDYDLIRREPAEQARRFRALAKNAREEASRLSGDLQAALLKSADNWEGLAEEAEAEVQDTLSTNG
jgi:hypothetical protein